MKTQALMALIIVEMKKLIRHPVNLFLNLLFPALLTIVFIFTFSDPELGMSINSVVPGLIVYAVIFLIMTVAQSFSSERNLLRRLNTTPMTSTEFIGSQILSNMVIAMIQVIVVIVLAILLGFRPESSFVGILIAVPITAIFALSSVGLGLITATVSKRPETGTGLSFLFILPQMFFGTFIPVSSSTQNIAQLVPSHYLFEGLQLIFQGSWTSNQLFFDMAVISVVSVVIIGIGIILFDRYGNI
ncbi:MAG: ABC transporter permease [Candidatus Bathyarchaeota archaeon]|nr:ABC transporter permease [Candidatus Bathyarchaeum sp.]